MKITCRGGVALHVVLDITANCECLDKIISNAISLLIHREGRQSEEQEDCNMVKMNVINFSYIYNIPNPTCCPLIERPSSIDHGYYKIMSRMLYAPYECKDKSHVECSSSSCQHCDCQLQQPHWVQAAGAVLHKPS